MKEQTEFEEYNFFKQVEKIDEHAKTVKDMSEDIAKESTKFIKFLKTQNFKKYKINPSKSHIFINKKDFGLELVHSECPDRNVSFSFNKYETPIIFNDKNDKFYDCRFGQGTNTTLNYLLMNLENIKKITSQGTYNTEDTIVDEKNNIIDTTEIMQISPIFHIRKLLNILPKKTTKKFTWK